MWLISWTRESYIPFNNRYDEDDDMEKMFSNIIHTSVDGGNVMHNIMGLMLHGSIPYVLV